MSIPVMQLFKKSSPSGVVQWLEQLHWQLWPEVQNLTKISFKEFLWEVRGSNPEPETMMLIPQSDG